MSERRRGLGRGLGALIPSAPAQDAREEGDAPQRGDHGDPGAGAAGGGAPGDVSRETSPAAGTEGRQAPTNGDGEPGTTVLGGSTTPDHDDRDAETGSAPPAADTSAPAAAGRTRSVTPAARQKAMKARMDMGEALRNTTLVSRPSDMFFLPSSSPQTSEDAERGPTGDGAPSTAASSTAGPSDVSHETSADGPSRNDDQRAESHDGDVSRTASPEPGPEGSADPSAGSDVPRETETEDPDLQAVPGARFAEVPVGSIHPNRKQPRQVFDEEELAELAYSIGELGVLQPIVVRSSREDGEQSYELVMGERRWRAAQRAGLPTIPAIVRETSDDDLLRDALLENLHRSQLNPLEEAAAYQQLLEEFGATQEELSRRIGRSRPQISNTIRLLRLPPLVQRRVAAGVLSSGHARALLSLSDPAEMERLAQRIVAEGLSVRATEEAVAMADGAQRKAKRAPTVPGRHQERLDDIAGAFADRLDTSVKIALGARKGKMTIEFASVEDLNRIVGVLGAGMDAS